MDSLSRFAGNVYSQNGEDGILAELFRRLGAQRGYFVEFGAWDGKHLSNSYALVEQGWTGCFIEGDTERFERLCSNVPAAEITKLNRFVAATGPDSLDAILDEAGAPETVDLLSIDIDSDDLAVWRGVQRHRARCVVIEYNPTIPFDLAIENPPGRTWGNSARAIDDHAGGAGYALVAVTSTNLIYVDAAEAEASGVARLSLSEVPAAMRYFWGYDGSLLRAGAEDSAAVHAPEIFLVPWAGAVAFQPVPKALRTFDPGTGVTLWRFAVAVLGALVLRPGAIVGEIVRIVRRRPRAAVR